MQQFILSHDSAEAQHKSIAIGVYRLFVVFRGAKYPAEVSRVR